MYTVLKNVLSVNEIAFVKELIVSGEFVDGRTTSDVVGKNNLQLSLESDKAQQAGRFIVERLLAHDDFNRAVHPHMIHPPLFSLYEVGMEYPDHIDVAIMDGLRTDVALTLFLNAKESYEGGELVVDTGNGIKEFRLEAGDAIAYPATTVHHVAQVTHGTRLVAVTWIQSLFRDPDERAIMYDLSVSMKNLEGTSCGPRISHSYWNLVRLWAETAPHPSPHSL